MKELKEKYIEFHRFKWPSVPDHARSLPNYFGQSSKTNGLTRLILCAIRLKGWQAERISSSGRYVDNSEVVTDCIGRQKKIGSGKYIRGTTQAGTADISANIDGRSVKIEVKNAATKDRMSDKQKDYKRRIELTGGVYYVATDIESFLEWLEQFPDNPNKLEMWSEFGV